jgi:hypothetical protein
LIALLLYTLLLRNKFETPPAPLVESYFECTKKQFDAFNNAIGIASGFAGSIGGTVLLVLIPVALYFRKPAKGPSKEELMDRLAEELVKAAEAASPNPQDIHDVVAIINNVLSPKVDAGMNDEKETVEYDANHDTAVLSTDEAG